MTPDSCYNEQEKYKNFEAAYAASHRTWNLYPTHQIHNKESGTLLFFEADLKDFTGKREAFLKVLTRKDLQFEDREFFISPTSSLREARIMSQLKEGPHLLKLLDFDYFPLSPDRTEPGIYVLMFMEKLQPLEEIRQQMRKQQTFFSLEELCQIASDICSALAEARNQFPKGHPLYGLCHCDIKPGNLFYDKKNNCYKLGDWDTAYLPEEADLLGGTIPYMAPEQLYQFLPNAATLRDSSALGEAWSEQWLESSGVLADEPMDRADIYALGIVLFLLCSGHFPLTELTPMCIRKVNYEAYKLQMDPDSFEKFERSLKKLPDPYQPLADIIAKAAAYYPADRYQTPEEMREALEHICPSSSDNIRQNIPAAIPDQTPALPPKTTQPPYAISCRITGDTRRITITGTDSALWGCLATGTNSLSEAKYRALSVHLFHGLTSAANEHTEHFDLSAGTVARRISADAKGYLLLYDAYGTLVFYSAYADLTEESL